MRLNPDSNNAATSFQWIAGGWSGLAILLKWKYVRTLVNIYLTHLKSIQLIYLDYRIDNNELIPY